MQTMLVQAACQMAACRFRQRVCEQMVDPDPGERAKRDLEGARPIHAALEGILCEPAFQLPADLVEKLLSSGQPVGLRQQHQVLMPVQLPNYLVIANAREIEIRYQPEITQSTLLPMDVIAPPVNLRPCVEDIPQQRETMCQN